MTDFTPATPGMLTLAEAILVLRTIPYKRAPSKTINTDGCMCAAGHLLACAGYEPIGHFGMWFIENRWIFNGQEITIYSGTAVAELLDLSSELGAFVERLSDRDELSGPQIADILAYGFTSSPEFNEFLNYVGR